MDESQIVALWRKHLAVLAFSEELLREAKKEYAQNGEVFEEDGMVERIIDNDSGDSYTLKASGGYTPGVDTLCEITDTGNGYIAYVPTYSSTMQDNYICMDYSEADYLRKLLAYIHKRTSK
jgi:hypothetical protein